MATFVPVDPRQSLPKLEEAILTFWREQRIFDKTLAEKTETGEARPIFVFYEGPPTANGKPGIHHVLARSFKDVIPRYKTMRGYRVPRKAGWDTHGLPVEVEVEKRLGLTGKRQIEELGIGRFNQACRESVFRYIADWDKLTERIGFWVDTEHPYRTLDNSYIESCWSLLKGLWDKGLLVQDYKVTKHCPRCGTSLAEAEAGLGMKEGVDDPSVTVRLRLVPGQALPFAPVAGDVDAGAAKGAETPTSLLIWTTTPWTLPANAAAAVHRTAPYALCERDIDGGVERLILLATQVEAVLGKDARVLGTAPGEALGGLRYEPLYPGVLGLGAAAAGTVTDAKDRDGAAAATLAAAYRVVVDETVEIGEGTGIVHIAPAYGDLEVGRRHGLPVLFSVGLDGLVLAAFPRFAGKFFKEADPLITRDLKERGLLFHSTRVHHSYPFCWRCGAPLIYFAKTSWYIRTTQVRDQMLAKNQEIAWYPEHIRDGRFGDWLRNNVDWALSRERYWGTPLPLWQCSGCERREVIGSIAELSARAGHDLAGREDLDLHRPQVDEWTWPCAAGDCTGRMVRVRDVIDCWFDSGAMPFAQHHYPFEHKEDFDQLFPAGFISEGVDQTRGWFYTLHAIGVLVTGGPAFRNCIVLGHILDEKGEKMSKTKGNVVDPWPVLDSEGADALRYYLYTASLPGQPRRFSQNLVKQSLRQFLLTLWNCYSFFVTYADAGAPGEQAEYDRLGREIIPWSERPVIDQWVLGRLHHLIGDATLALEGYDLTTAARGVAEFVDELSNWYVRRNRDRFWSSLDGATIGDEVERSKRAAYQTLRECLLTVAQLGAPFIPFMAEEIWQNLAHGRSFSLASAGAAAAPLAAARPGVAESVHLSSWPVADPAILAGTADLLAEMGTILQVVALGRAARMDHSLKTRQPLSEVLVQVPSAVARRALSRFEREVREELNVEQVTLATEGRQLVSYTVRPNLPRLGKKYGRRVKIIQDALLASGEADRQVWAEAVLREQPVTVQTADGPLQLEADEVLLSSQSVEGFAAKAQGGLVVAIATEVTPELRDKGIAREVVRAIGDLRKRAGCRVSDRVQVCYVAPGPTAAAALLQHGAYVADETLAALTEGELPGATVTGEVELDEGVLRLSLK